MRLTREEIDRGIIDVAASVFAQHGYAHTSVQQIADAVGYSKTGLLHRFGTKDGIFKSGLAVGEQMVDDLLEQGSTLPFDEHRERRILEMLVREALAHPGLSQLLIRSFEPAGESPYDERIRELGYRLLALVNPPFSTSVERLRSALALEMVVTAATAQTKRIQFDVSVPHDELVPLLVDLALQTMYSPAGVVASVS